MAKLNKAKSLPGIFVWVVLGIFMIPLACFAMKLKFLAHYQIPHKMKFKNTRIGGISGATWDSQKRKLWVVSDDRGYVSEPRIYGFDFHWDKNDFKLTATDVIFFAQPRAKPQRPVYDLEGIAFRDGKFLLSSEGDNNQKPRAMPRIFEFDPDSKAQKDFKIPNEFLPELSGQQTKGIRNNSGFEGLTISPTGRKIVAGLERPLVQNSQKGQTQILVFEGTAEPRVLTYQLDQEVVAEGIKIDQGLSELLLLDENRLLILERAAFLAPQKITFPSRIYEVLLPDTNKKLVLNLAELDPEYSLENFEAMAKVDNFLILIADDNFKKRQKTTFLLFEIYDR